jgi:hypothetical protein
MLAYVLWHWKRAEASLESYEARQREFHAALAAAPPHGYVRSFSVRVAGAPWVPLRDAYEDWYLVDDFEALGALNDAATSASRALPHEAAAALASGGTAGLYRLRAGDALDAPAYATWFGKPDGVGYPQLFAELAPRIESAQGALWLRQMTFGPARELCLHSAAPVTLPSEYAPLVLPLAHVSPP